MVRYRHNVAGPGALVEYIRFQDGRISEIQVYVSKLPERP